MSKESRRVTDLSVGKAQARFIRVTPMKARRMINLVRGQNANQAITAMKFAPQAAALPVRKLIESAVASIVQKRESNGLDIDRNALYVAEAYVDEAPTMKRFRPRAQGRAGRIMKRTSHITVVVKQANEKESL